MNAVPPNPATTSKFSSEVYALSADTSPMVNVFAVSVTSGANCGLSAASLSRIRIAVTMFVFTPHAIWAFTQTHLLRVTPYFWSNHFSNLLLPNPLESTAKSVSTAFSGAALLAINSFKMGVNSGFSMNLQTLMPGTSAERYPLSRALRRSEENRRALTVL